MKVHLDEYSSYLYVVFKFANIRGLDNMQQIMSDMTQLD